MENKYCYAKIIVVGSGKLAHQCAAEGKKRLEKVEVLEHKVTDGTVLQKLCEKDGLFYRCCDKEELRQRLSQEKEKTLVVSAGNTWLIPKTIVTKSNLMIVNWHNALLPRHRGRNAEAWSIYQGDAETGITWHRLTEGVDTGDIIAQERIPVDGVVTALKLFQQQCDLGIQVFQRILVPLLLEQCEFCRQEEIAEEQLHFSYEVPNEGWLDTAWSYDKISRFLRAMDYGALKLLGEMRVRWQDDVYSFSRYRITKAEEAESIDLEDGDMVIIRDGHKIVLKSLKKEITNNGREYLGSVKANKSRC